MGSVHIDAREAEEHAGGQGQVSEAEAISEGIERLGRGVTLDTLPWASHTTVKMTMNASGMNVPMMTPYLVRRAKAFTPLVDRKVRPQ